jgi:prevent-host-death family protein
MRLAKNVVKAKLLEYFRYVESTGEEIIVTDNGRPSVRICPIKRGDKVEELFAEYRGKVEIKGDVLASSSDEWGNI